jgi:hypothetical protein
MKQRTAKIPKQVRNARLAEALERLVKFYDAVGKPDEAAKWRVELDAYGRTEVKPANTKDK